MHFLVKMVKCWCIIAVGAVIRLLQYCLLPCTLLLCVCMCMCICAHARMSCMCMLHVHVCTLYTCMYMLIILSCVCKIV